MKLLKLLCFVGRVEMTKVKNKVGEISVKINLWL